MRDWGYDNFVSNSDISADRKRAAESIGIRFVVRVESTGLGSIEPVDVTTLFGKKN